MFRIALEAEKADRLIFCDIGKRAECVSGVRFRKMKRVDSPKFVNSACAGGFAPGLGIAELDEMTIGDPFALQSLSESGLRKPYFSRDGDGANIRQHIDANRFEGLDKSVEVRPLIADRVDDAHFHLAVGFIKLAGAGLRSC